MQMEVRLSDEVYAVNKLITERKKVSHRVREGISTEILFPLNPLNSSGQF